jgi:hypothetical protein
MKHRIVHTLQKSARAPALARWSVAWQRQECNRRAPVLVEAEFGAGFGPDGGDFAAEFFG